MSLARVVITSVTVEGRSKSAVAREYGVSRVWVQKLVHRSLPAGRAYAHDGPVAALLDSAIPFLAEQGSR